MSDTKRRTRLFMLGDWTSPVFDTDTSDQPPTDYLLYGPYRELNVTHEIIDEVGRVKFRWSGTWSQTSRRKFVEFDHREFLKLLTWPEVTLAPMYIPPAFVRDVPEPTEEERRRSLRYQPVAEVLAGVKDASLRITFDHWLPGRG